MNSILFVNQIIRWSSSEKNEINERILWIDENYIICYVIDIFTKKGFPYIRKIEELHDAIKSGEAAICLDDPYVRLISEEDISDNKKQLRDKEWNNICAIANNEPDIFEREKRGILVKGASEQNGVSTPTVYRNLRRYWQRGKNKNAFLPDYFNCGRNSDRRLADKKLGRPRKNKEHIGVGLNVDEETKKIFRIAANRYYHTKKQNTFTTVYDLMIKDFFTEHYIIENGVKKPILVNENNIPTIRQFRYWYRKENDIKKKLVSRKGAKEFELNHRAVLGRADKNVEGPGSRYEIDATVADVYLRSRYNRDWIIGRPVIYVVIDVFSRMVTGLYVGLEGPSWNGAMMALSNALTDKVAYCKEYDIDIETIDWPCFHLPDKILADRGEMEGKKGEQFIESLKITIQNTPPYRGDWKGIIEQYFRTINLKVKPFTPGYIDVDYRKRGARDYRLDAQLDIYQFTQIIIRCILKHNNEKWLDNYTRDVIAIADDVNPIPRKLWLWGIQNRSGRLRTLPEDIIKLNLMPTAKATVTFRGIKFKSCLYSCDKAVKELWFETARNEGSWKIDISYDPRNMNIIYIRDETCRAFDKCYLIDDERYGNKTYDEITYLEEYENLQSEINRTKSLQSRIDLNAEIQSIVENAKKMNEQNISVNESNASKIKGIREHRKTEKMINRSNEAFELDEDKNKRAEKNAKVIPIRDGAEDEFKYPNYTEMLMKIQKENLENEE